MTAPMVPLNPNQIRFVDYLLADEKLNTTEAYARAYSSTDRGTAGRNGSRLAKDPRVKALIAERRQATAAKLGLSAEELVAELAAVVGADPRDLIEYRRGACRYCHGIGFEWQRTPAEWRNDLAAYVRMQHALELAGKKGDPLGLAFPAQGGVGFNPNAEAHPDCPECHGHGVGYSYPKDSRTLTPAAARLFAGIKETKDGLEIKTRSVDKSLELYMRHLGLLTDKTETKTPEQQAEAVRALLAAAKATTGGPARGQ